MTDLPHGWVETTIGELVDRLQYGYTAKASMELDGPRFLRITDIEDGSIEWGEVPSCKISQEDFARYELRDGDLVFARTGSIDKAARVRNPPKSVFASYLIRGRPLLPGLGDWLAAFVSCSAYVSQAMAASAGIGRANINAKNLGKIRLPLAPVEEQGRVIAAIESYLPRLNDAVEGLGRVQRNLKRYRASVLQAAIEGRLVPTEAELARAEGRDYEPASELLKRILAERRRRWENAELEKLKAKGKPPKDDRWKRKYKEPAEPDTSALPPLPEGWCWARIDTVGRVQLGRQRSPRHHSGAHMRPYLRVANVFEDRIDTGDVMTMNFSPEEFKTYSLKVGDILLNEGQSPHLVGRPAMYRGEVPGACFTNSLVRFQASIGVDPRYALVVFLAQLHARRYMRIAQITTNIAHLGAGRFAEIEFPLPPKQEQQRIADELERVMTTVTAARSALAGSSNRIGRLRQSILAWAFEGRLVDQDPDDEPAAVLLERIRKNREAAGGQAKKAGRGRGRARG